MKAVQKALFLLCMVLGVSLALAAVLTHLGFYEASGSDVAIDLNSGRLRTRSFFLWIRVGENVEDSMVSQILTEAKIHPGAPPQWKLTSARSWPARVHPHFEFGRAAVCLAQAELLLSNPSVGANERERIAAAFIRHLAKADIQGLEEMLRAEVKK